MNINYFGEKIIASVSRRTHGSMRLHGHEQLDEPVYAQREKFLTSLGIPPDKVVAAELIHGAFAEVVNKPLGHKVKIKNIDTLITSTKGVALSITNADCPTIFLYDPINRVIGISHAGGKEFLPVLLKNVLRASKG